MPRKYRFSFFLLLFGLQISAQQTVGLFKNSDEAFNGYTLFGNNKTTYLIDNCGFEVHRWESDFAPGLSQYLLPNGNLLRSGRIAGSFGTIGTGGHFEILDWDSNVLWSMDFASDKFHPHHDIEPLPNGNFLTLLWEKHSAADALAAGRKYDGEVWTEKIAEIKPTGTDGFEIVWEWRTWDHLIQDFDASKPNFGVVAEHPELMDFNYVHKDEEPLNNWLHANAISYNPTLDQIAISLRHTSEIWVIDHSTTTAEAASHSSGNSGKGGDILYRFGNPAVYDRGSASDQLFFGQHDVRWIPEGYPNEGMMMVFNNNFDAQKSSVEMWRPPLSSTGEYFLEDGKAFGPRGVSSHFEAVNFHSRSRSGAQPLPNGNWLICQAEGGRFFEVTREHDLVWDYINPVNYNGGSVSQGTTARFNDVFRCQRYSVDYQGFVNKNLTPIAPIELNPSPNDCEIFETSSSVSRQVSAEKIRLLENPVFEFLKIENLNSGEDLQGIIFDFSGKKKIELTLKKGINEIDVSFLPKGVYFLKIKGNSKGVIFFCA